MTTKGPRPCICVALFLFWYVTRRMMQDEEEKEPSLRSIYSINCATAPYFFWLLYLRQLVRDVVIDRLTWNSPYSAEFNSLDGAF